MAMKNTFLTQKDAEKFKFNEEAKLPVNSQEVVIYYLYLINLAAELGIISKENCNQVASNLMGFIFVDVDERCIAGVNLQYIISSYLLTFSPYDALRKVLTYNEGNGLINEAKKWFSRMISSLKRNLVGIHNTVVCINAENVTCTYEELSRAIIQMESALKKDTEFSFKSMPEKWNPVYESLHEENGINYIETLKMILKSFAVEVRLMKKLNGKELLSQLQNEFKNFLGEYYVDNEKEKLEIKLQELEKSYHKKLEKGLAQEIKIDSLIEEFDEKFGKEHPEIDEGCEEYDDILEEFIVSRIGEYEAFDADELKRKYQKRREEILYKLSKMDNEVSEFDLDKISSQGELVEEHISLKIILKEYCVFNKCNSGIWEYPNSIEERARLYDQVDLRETIENFVKEFQSKLNSYEIIYLKTYKPSW